MNHKVTVGLQQKIGQPNFGSVGASCSIEIHLDDDEAEHPDQIANRVKHAFAQCRECIAKELSIHEANGSVATSTAAKPSDARQSPARKATSERPARNATEAQVRAIASKAGLSLASELEQGFGVRSPNQLTIAQASQLIDSLKQSLAPSPV